jgi:hypothetical protein
MSIKQKFVVLQLSGGQLHGCSMMGGRLKLTEPVPMGRGTLILFSMEPAVVQLGRLVTRNSLLTHYQKKVGRAFELLALDLLAKLAEVRGVEKAGQELTRTHSKRNLNGKR